MADLYALCMLDLGTPASPADAPFNDIALQTRLREYDDSELGQAGLKMMRRHSWYVSPELATMVLFSDKISDAAKAELVANITDERGPHLLRATAHCERLAALAVFLCNDHLR